MKVWLRETTYRGQESRKPDLQLHGLQNLPQWISLRYSCKPSARPSSLTWRVYWKRFFQIQPEPVITFSPFWDSSPGTTVFPPQKPRVLSMHMCVCMCAYQCTPPEVNSIPCSFSNMCFTLILNLVFSKPFLLYLYFSQWPQCCPYTAMVTVVSVRVVFHFKKPKICLPQFHPNSLGPFRQGPLTHALNRGVAGDSQISENCPHRLPSLVQTHWCTPSIEETTHTFKNQHAHTNRPPPKFSDFSNTVVTVAMAVTYRHVHGWW